LNVGIKKLLNDRLKVTGSSFGLETTAKKIRKPAPSPVMLP
jgi:hypothetical protein